MSSPIAGLFDRTISQVSAGSERSTLCTRVETVAGANRLVGFPWHALREACYSNYADRLIIVDYDLITSRPREVFDLLYEFLGEEPFRHDFGDVDYDAPEFDAQLGTDGLHRVHKTVEPRPRETILPPDLFQRYINMSFWRDLPNSKAFRIVAQKPDQPQDRALSAPGGQSHPQENPQA